MRYFLTVTSAFLIEEHVYVECATYLIVCFCKLLVGRQPNKLFQKTTKRTHLNRQYTLHRAPLYMRPIYQVSAQQLEPAKPTNFLDNCPLLPISRLISTVSLDIVGRLRRKQNCHSKTGFIGFRIQYEFSLCAYIVYRNATLNSS